MKFGISAGDTLREAKHAAAINTLNIFDYTVLAEDEPSAHHNVFDKIPADDASVIPSIEEFSALGVKTPYEILLTFLGRQYSPDFEERELEYVESSIEDGRTSYMMKYKEHFEVKGECESSQPVKEVR